MREPPSRGPAPSAPHSTLPMPSSSGAPASTAPIAPAPLHKRQTKVAQRFSGDNSGASQERVLGRLLLSRCPCLPLTSKLEFVDLCRPGWDCQMGLPPRDAIASATSLRTRKQESVPMLQVTTIPTLGDTGDLIRVEHNPAPGSTKW